MKIYIIIASVNELVNLEAFKPMLMKHDCRVVVIDEGDWKLREKNNGLISEISHVYYGPREREDWFKSHFGSTYQKYLSIIPEKCHAETSFGFLVAYKEAADVIITIDDDVFPVRGYDFINNHIDNLLNDNGAMVYSKGKWYNSMENIELNIDAKIFPRGHPYQKETRIENYIWVNKGDKCVLNMGLWTGHPDLDALTVLYHGGLDGRCSIESKKCKRRKVVVDKGTYFAICSMNTSFLSKIIPAFYQLHMNFMGIDRYDDIWSGMLLKKIADHLGDGVCLGEPIAYHEKRSRDVFKDLKKELDGMIINEFLWKMIDEIELDGETYWDSYSSLIDCLEKLVKQLQNALHKKFMQIQIAKMKTWLKILDKID